MNRWYLDENDKDVYFKDENDTRWDYNQKEIVRILNTLEAKLAESEKKFIIANNLRKNADEVLLNYKTEKYGLDKTIQELRKIKLSFPEKEWYYKGFENCERQMSSHIADLTLEVKQLKQQLAEKDKEIEELKHFKVTIGTMETNQVDISSTTYTDQDKISFCIEQLRWVEKLLLDNAFNDLSVVLEEIDNQIEELKKGVK